MVSHDFGLWWLVVMLCGPERPRLRALPNPIQRLEMQEFLPQSIGHQPPCLRFCKHFEAVCKRFTCHTDLLLAQSHCKAAFSKLRCCFPRLLRHFSTAMTSVLSLRSPSVSMAEERAQRPRKLPALAVGTGRGCGAPDVAVAGIEFSDSNGHPRCRSPENGRARQHHRSAAESC